MQLFRYHSFGHHHNIPAVMCRSLMNSVFEHKDSTAGNFIRMCCTVISCSHHPIAAIHHRCCSRCQHPQLLVDHQRLSVIACWRHNNRSVCYCILPIAYRTCAFRLPIAFTDPICFIAIYCILHSAVEALSPAIGFKTACLEWSCFKITRFVSSH